MLGSLTDEEVSRCREDAMLYLTHTSDDIVGFGVVEGERVTFNTRSGRAVSVDASGIRYYRPRLLERIYLSVFK